MVSSWHGDIIAIPCGESSSIDGSKHNDSINAVISLSRLDVFVDLSILSNDFTSLLVFNLSASSREELS